ncbi:hypothetical protein AAE478_000354 [Parahypoxylon ruwenzoriense]
MAAAESYEFVCANSGQNSPQCARVGKLACKECRLVLYCGTTCQKAHWKKHRSDCRDNPLLKQNWRPQWETQARVPAFIGGPRLHTFNDQKKYLWGNMPAFDLLNLTSNEGTNYNKKLDLLFAASGDIRNVIKTIVSIPDEFKKPIKIHMNDRDADIVGRNAIMLLLALTEDSADVAVDNILHLWYSSFISQSLQDTLKGKIRELVQSVCTKIESKAPDAVLGKTWTFGSRSLRLVLAKKQWLELLASLEPPPGLTVDKAREIRRSVTIAPQRVDYRERRYFVQPPSHRTSAQKFREDGVLLPFGGPRDIYTIPNPTLFRNPRIWPMKDDSDPLDGWDRSEILSISSGAATNDVYGKFFLMLRGILFRFHSCLKNSEIAFKLLNVDAVDLHNYVGTDLFDRIETIYYIGRLLKPPYENPQATLVTLFLNAVDESFDDADKRRVAESEMKEVFKYMPPTPPTGFYDASLIVSDIATQQVRDVDKYFDRYMKTQRFSDLHELSSIAPKEKHTIIDPWPMRLKKKPHQRGAKEEFTILLSSNHSGCERYMEWKYSM